MEIEEEKLAYLLDSKKHHLKTKDFFIQSLFALLGVALSFFFSNFAELPFINKIAIVICGIFYLILFCVSVYGANYSPEALFNDICSCSVIHQFSLIIIKNSNGEYLLKKDSRWKTFLFPYKRTKTNDIEDLKSFMDYSFGIKDYKIIKSTETEISKHSVSANLIKSYHHTFYFIETDLNVFPKKNKFKLNKNVYKWYSIDAIKKDKNMLLKNKETIDFVEQTF